MKFSRTFLALLGLLSVVCAIRADDIPARPKFDRYAGMLNRSPFALATAPTAQAPTPNFAKDLYIANVAHTKDADLVTLQSAVDRNMKEYLSTTEINSHGYKIISIDWSERPGETKVTISKDGQVAPLSFNQAVVSQSLPPSAPANQPAVPLPAGYMPPKPAAVPNMPSPPNQHVRPTIQRVPSSALINAPPNTAASQAEKE